MRAPFFSGSIKPIAMSTMLFLMALLFFSCDKDNGGGGNNPPVNPPIVDSDVDFWLTTGNQVNLFKKQNVKLDWSTNTSSNATIELNPNQTYQSIDGFGYSLTGGSAEHLGRLNAAARAEILDNLFRTDSTNIGVSYLRVSIGASDLSSYVFSYNDIPTGETDINLDHFSLGPDTTYLIPVLKEILAINPDIKIMGSPWSPPIWMKTNQNSVGGRLLEEYYDVYARYFVRYINEMQARGIRIDAITIQNEPYHGGNNPSMEMSPAEQAAFIKDHLGPAFRDNNLTTKIVIWDHNCDRPDFPLNVMADPTVKVFIDGTAWHLYGGDIGALSTVRNAHPDKNQYFTEQYTASTGDFAGDLRWHVKNVIIGSMRNWSKNALEWNLANDINFGPHTPGGCTTCKGALTFGNTIERNVAYYIIAHASKFVRPGSVRIATDIVGSLFNVAFITPEGKKVLIVMNDGTSTQTFNIKYDGKSVATSLDVGAVGTYVWD